MLISAEIKTVLTNSISILHHDLSFSGNYNDYILQMLFLKWLLDIQAEKYIERDHSNIIFNIPKEINWLVVENLKEDIGEKLTDIFNCIESADSKLKDIFVNPKINQWNRINDCTLKQLIENFSILDLRSHILKRPDLLGDIYENLTINSELHEVKTNVNYFTPRHITKLIVDLATPQTKMQIYDPACGSGGMLIECVRQFQEKGEEFHNILLYGQEEDYELRSIAKINLLLKGVEHSQILSGNIIQNNSLEKFDLVIANPPFGIKNWGVHSKKHDLLHQFSYGNPPKNSADYAFIQRILSTLKNTGKAAIIVPHGVLFRGGVESEIRKNIIEDDLIEAVIGLPANLFYNTKIPTAIIIFNRNKLENRKNRILFIDASHEYKMENRKKNFLTNDHIAKIVSIYSNFHEEIGYSKIASAKEVADYNYILDITHFVKPLYPENGLDIDSQVKKVQTLETQRNKIEAQMDSCLRILGIEI
ncbi:MAG: hypothetical protein EA343_21475 [Nodularia sp. (in: Bacteria)]|nr:MAG: hypothetical protein EA343_21475 [Nodularia sp. (in: cyanobacteria)]